MSDQSSPDHPNQSQSRMWDMLCHLTALAGFIIPFGNIIGPLLVWQIKKNEVPSVVVHGKEALNFQISITLYCIVSALLIFLLIGIVMLFALALADLVLIIIAGIKANNGETYKYPLTLRLIK